MQRIFYLIIPLAILLAACGSSADLPADGATIEWAQAVEILNSGQVTQIFQTHALEVTLTLEDGRQLHTIEPHIDAIFQEIEACGAPCAWNSRSEFLWSLPLANSTIFLMATE